MYQYPKPTISATTCNVISRPEGAAIARESLVGWHTAQLVFDRFTISSNQQGRNESCHVFFYISFSVPLDFGIKLNNTSCVHSAFFQSEISLGECPIKTFCRC